MSKTANTIDILRNNVLQQQSVFHYFGSVYCTLLFAKMLFLNE